KRVNSLTQKRTQCASSGSRWAHYEWKEMNLRSGRSSPVEKLGLLLPGEKRKLSSAVRPLEEIAGSGPRRPLSPDLAFHFGSSSGGKRVRLEHDCRLASRSTRGSHNVWNHSQCNSNSTSHLACLGRRRWTS